MKEYYQGLFKPKHPEKYKGNSSNIVYRSGWELKFMKWCDNNDNILEYASEEIVIPYFDTVTKKVRRYFPDFYMKILDKNKNIRKYIVEIKPYKQTIPPKKGKKSTKNFLYESIQYEKNQCKWNAAKTFCNNNNLEFIVITERELFNNFK